MDDSAQNNVPEESVVMSDGNFVGTPPVTTTTTTTSTTPVSGSTQNLKPKGKGYTGKIVATIFGILLLVGGVGAGIVLVNQQQLISQKAAGVGGTCAGAGWSCGPNSVACSHFSSSSADNSSECQSNYQTGQTCTGGCVWYPNSGVDLGNGAGGGGSAQQCTSAGSVCSGNTCTISSAGAANGFQVKKCTCSEHAYSACNSNCTFSSGSLTVPTPACGRVQLDIVDKDQKELACTNTQVILTGSTDCAGGGGGGSCVSDYCQTPALCNASGGTTGGQGNRPSGGSCQTGTVMCCVNTPAPTPTPRKAICGESCKTDSDCGITSGGGFQPVCSAGKCVNPLCPNDTTPGTICACGTGGGGKCGDLCGANGNKIYPLCSAGFVCGNQQNGSGNTGDTGNRCLPNPAPAGYVTGGGICAGDKNPQVFCLNHTDGTHVTAVSDLLAACAPPAAPQCTNLGAYDTNWNALTAAQLSQLTSGTNVYFTVTGTTSSAFDMARFTINGALEPNTTLKKPGSTSIYYFQYTIPAGVTSFTVSAQLHDTGTNQWY